MVGGGNVQTATAIVRCPQWLTRIPSLGMATGCSKKSYLNLLSCFPEAMNIETFIMGNNLRILTVIIPQRLECHPVT